MTALVVTTVAACATGTATREERPQGRDAGETRTAMSRRPPAPPAAARPRAELKREEMLKYQEAVRLFREEERPEEAYELLDAFQVMHPGSEFADDAMLEQARIMLHLEKPGRSAGIINKLLKKFPASSLRKRAFLELEKIQFAQEKWRACIEAGRSVTQLDPLPDELSEALTLRGRCLLQRKSWDEGLTDLVDGYRAAGSEEARLKAAGAIEEVKDDLRDRHLDRALERSDGQAPYGLLALIRIERDTKRGIYESAMAGFMDLLVHYPDQLDQERVDALFTSLSARIDVKSDSIGILLPLSGRYGVFGQRALQGIQTAFGYMSPVEDQGQPPRYTLVVRDTGAEPRQAEQAVRELVRDEHVVGIIGPVFSRTSRAAAEAASETGTPVLTLTADPLIPGTGGHVFSRALTDEQQVRALVRMSFDHLGVRRFGILYPESSYGEGMMNLFWDELDQAGGEVTAVESFPPGGPDFGPQVSALVGLDRPLNEEQRQLKADGVEVEQEPVVDFEGLFIPADFQTVGLLAPQLAFHEVNHILILGTDGWNSPWLTELGEHYVEGALFTGGFDLGSEDPEVRELVQDYWLAFGEDPGALSVQAYDAARIVRTAIDSGQVRDRAELTAYIAALAEFPSAEGPLTTDADGVIRQKTQLLTVHKGALGQFRFKAY